MDSDIGVLGASVVAAILILREVFGFLKAQKLKQQESVTLVMISDRLSRIEGSCGHSKNKIDDLYDWHNTKDSDGVFAWYVRKSLEEALVSLAKNIESQTDILRNIVNTQATMSRDVHDLQKKIS